MFLLVATIADNLRNVSVLASLPILAYLFLCGSSVSLESRGTAFLPVVVLPSSVRLSLLVFSGLFGGLGSLFGLVVLTLVMALTLGGRAAFWLGLFSLIARIGTHFQ